MTWRVGGTGGGLTRSKNGSLPRHCCLGKCEGCFGASWDYRVPYFELVGRARRGYLVFPLLIGRWNSHLWYWGSLWRVRGPHLARLRSAMARSRPVWVRGFGCTHCRCCPCPDGGGMIGSSHKDRLMVATRPIDFPKGHNSMAGMVQNELRKDPFTGTVFVFRARKPDRMTLFTGMMRGIGKQSGGLFIRRTAMPDITGC